MANPTPSSYCSRVFPAPPLLLRLRPRPDSIERPRIQRPQLWPLLQHSYAQPSLAFDPRQTLRPQLHVPMNAKLSFGDLLKTRDALTETDKYHYAD